MPLSICMHVSSIVGSPETAGEDTAGKDTVGEGILFIAGDHLCFMPLTP